MAKGKRFITARIAARIKARAERESGERIKCAPKDESVESEKATRIAARSCPRKKSRTGNDPIGDVVADGV